MNYPTVMLVILGTGPNKRSLLRMRGRKLVKLVRCMWEKFRTKRLITFSEYSFLLSNEFSINFLQFLYAFVFQMAAIRRHRMIGG